MNSINLFKASLALMLFSIAIVIFQLSCSKPINAQGSTGRGSVILYAVKNQNGVTELWRANIDGTSQQKINIALPPDYLLDIMDGAAFISPDNQRIYFQASSPAGQDFIYSCLLDGSDMIRVIDAPANSTIELTYLK